MKTLTQILTEATVLDLVKIVAYSGFISPNENKVPIELYVTFRDVSLNDLKALVDTVDKAGKYIVKELEKEGLEKAEEWTIRIQNAGYYTKVMQRIKFRDPENKFKSLMKKYKIQYSKN